MRTPALCLPGAVWRGVWAEENTFLVRSREQWGMKSTEAPWVTTSLCQATEDAEPQAGSGQSGWGTLQNACFVKICSPLGTEIWFFFTILLLILLLYLMRVGEGQVHVACRSRGQRPVLDVTLWNAFCLLRDEVCLWPGIHQWGKTGWPWALGIAWFLPPQPGWQVQPWPVFLNYGFWRSELRSPCLHCKPYPQCPDIDFKKK